MSIVWQNTNAQYKQAELFKGDSGFILLNKIALNYKPGIVLDYSQARVKMYSEIYNVRDTVFCVYSHHALYVNHNSTDPIGDLYKGGSANGINCEHTFPQSKGAEIGNARSDMHHLYPVRSAVNEARLNYPFGEINDNVTDNWFYKTLSLTTKPSTQIDEYSEGINGVFEPREDHKGNVARAIFYFFTMYELQSDRSFFEQMKPTLCDWHIKDPVDSSEWARTYAIAKYQENKINPFVLDCSLSNRTYCPSGSKCKLPNSIDEVFSFIKIQFDQNTKTIAINNMDNSYGLEIALLNITGQEILSKTILEHQNEIINCNNLIPGIHLLQMKAKGYTKLSKIPIY